MTKTAHLFIAVAALSCCAALAGCNSSVAPASAPGGAQAAAPAGQTTAESSHLSNISGDYKGTMEDWQGGRGTATAMLAQHRDDAGGAITLKRTNQTTIVAEISLTIATSNKTSGAMAIDFPPQGSGPTCTFATTGTYDPTTNILRGSFTTISGCNGDFGTYKLTHLCHGTIVTGSEDVRDNNPKC